MDTNAKKVTHQAEPTAVHTEALKEDLMYYRSPSFRTADPAATLYRISIRDGGQTMIDDIFVTRLGCGWIVIDQNYKMTIFLPDSMRSQCTTFAGVRGTLRSYNEALRTNWGCYGGTRTAFFYFLAQFKQTPDKLPRWIDVEPYRMQMIKNQPKTLGTNLKV